MAPKYRGCKFCITITSSQHFRVPHICIRDDNNQTKKNERILQLNNIKINQLGNKFLVPFPHSCIMLARIFFLFQSMPDNFISISNSISKKHAEKKKGEEDAHMPTWTACACVHLYFVRVYWTCWKDMRRKFSLSFRVKIGCVCADCDWEWVGSFSNE